MRSPSRTGGRLFCALIGLWLGLVLSTLAHAQTETVDPELAKLRSEIAASRSRVVSHEREERDLVQLLEDVDRGLDALDGQVGASGTWLVGHDNDRPRTRGTGSAATGGSTRALAAASLE